MNTPIESWKEKRMELNNKGIGEVVLSDLSLDALLDRQAVCIGIMKYLNQATEGRHYTQTELDLLKIVSNDCYRCGELIVKKLDEMFTI